MRNQPRKTIQTTNAAYPDITIIGLGLLRVRFLAEAKWAASLELVKKCAKAVDMTVPSKNMR
jgi:hypothetical protein